jgi:2',3'-cyclic-nucleotide 2'-phosphodiesterase (5'-nucleotidase family)
MNNKPWIKSAGLTALMLSVLGLNGCNLTEEDNTQARAQISAKAHSVAGYRQFNVMAVNDIYNIEGIDARKSGGMARLRSLRKQMSHQDEQVLLLHAGDFLFPSSMSSQYKGEQMIDLMNALNGADQGFDDRFYVVFGNHEFDKKKMKDAPMLAQRIEESDFYWLGTNITLDKTATKDTKGFRRSLLTNDITEINGVKVGIYGLTTDIAIPEYATIDNDYLAVSKRQIRQLKAKGAEVIIAVTHLRIAEDEQLLKQLGDNGPDVIFGGHEHARQHVCVAKRCVIKADADIRSATVATISVSPDGKVDTSHHYMILAETTIDSDPVVEARTNYWINRYEADYCKANEQDQGCLLKVIGKTDVELIAEELEIRRFETNLGSYVADHMVDMFDDVQLPDGKKVQIGLTNAGSLRLNQNIPAGTELNEWYMNGIFQYPVDVRVIEISGKQLREVVNHSIEDWSGNGWWLQSSGIAFRHDVANNRATDLSLIDKQGKLTPVKDSDRIVASVNGYIANPQGSDQDGYTMLNLDTELVYYQEQPIDLKTSITKAIKAKWDKGQAISPVLPGRVCNSERPFNPCVFNK